MRPIPAVTLALAWCGLACGRGPALAQVDAAAGPALVSEAPARPTAPAADGQAASYSIGLYFGTQLRSSGVQDVLVFDELARGLADALAGMLASDDDKERMGTMLREGRQALAARNRTQAAAFLGQNGKLAGVVTTGSGLQYSVVKPGDAAARSPRTTDRVTVRYRGYLPDGSLFDSSDKHAAPATFAINGGVIAGWKEALLLMRPGAQWRIWLPPDLAYGDGSPPGIPAGSMLVFDIQLQKIEVPGPAPARPAKPAGSPAR